MKKVIGFIGCVMLLCSCGIYKKYERPAVNTNNLYGKEAVLFDTVSIGQLHWSELFTDPQLRRLIEDGLKRNTDLRIAYLKVQEAQAALQSSRLTYLPSVSLEPQGSASSFDGRKATQTYRFAVTAGWEIDLFGKLTNAKRGAKAALEETEYYRQAVQTQLVSTIANNYYTLLMLDEQLDIMERTLDTWRESVKTIRALKNAGQATEAAVAQAESSCLSVESSVLSLKRQIKETENGLSSLLADTPGHIERGTLEGQHFPDSLSAGIPLVLLSKRPDVKQAEAALARSYYATNEARSAFYPSITLSGTAGWTNSDGGSIVNPGTWLLQAIGSLVQPIFNRGTNIARLKIAKAQEEEALLAFQQSLLNAGSEVNNALVQWQTAREQIVLGKQQITKLGIAAKSTQLLMEHGNTSCLEVLVAQQTLLQAELEQVANGFNEIQGVISLYHAVGGGAYPRLEEPGTHP